MRALICLLCAVCSLATAAPPAPTEVIEPADLPRLAKLAAPAAAEAFKRLLPPADLVVSDDGLRLLIVSVATPLPSKGDGATPVFFSLIEKPKERTSVLLKEIKAVTYWEDRVLAVVDEINKAEKPALAELEASEWLLRSAARFHETARSRTARAGADKAYDPWKDLERRLRSKLVATRAQVLAALPASSAETDWALACHAARSWLSLDPKSRPLQEAAGDLLLRHARARWRAGDAKAARASLDWLDAHLSPLPSAMDLRQEMKKLAVELVQEAIVNPKSSKLLREALDLWPRVPEAADEVARREKTYRVLYVAVPALPRRLTPLSATTAVEKQALDLLFSRLSEQRWHGRPDSFFALPNSGLLQALPAAKERTLPLDLRMDHHWPDDRAVTAQDVRHTYDLALGPLAGRNPLLREFLVKPRLPEERYHLDLQLRQDLFDPLAVTRLHVLPAQYASAKGLVALEDPSAADFAARPVGSGPFLFAGVVKEEGVEFALFRRNPSYPGPVGKSGSYLGEIRFFVWSGAKGTKEPQPHLVFAPTPDQAAELSKLGYHRPTLTPGRTLQALALNHNHPVLAITEVRQALAHGVPRGEILKDWNAGKTAPLALSASGPFPPDSWAYPPATSFKADPFPKGSDRLHAGLAAKKVFETLKTKSIQLTLLHANEDGRMPAACTRMANSWKAAFAAAGLELEFNVKAVGAHALKDALDKHDYHLAWCEIDHPEDLAALWSLLDDNDQAVASPLGGNVLGYRHDSELTGLFRKTLVEQTFPQVRAGYHKIHMHLYQTMPFVPLWHEPPGLAVHPALQTGTLDPRQVFQNVLEWSVK